MLNPLTLRSFLRSFFSGHCCLPPGLLSVSFAWYFAFFINYSSEKFLQITVPKNGFFPFRLKVDFSMFSCLHTDVDLIWMLYFFLLSVWKLAVRISVGQAGLIVQYVVRSGQVRRQSSLNPRNFFTGFSSRSPPPPPTPTPKNNKKDNSLFESSCIHLPHRRFLLILFFLLCS